jgi:hypothetical protein
MQYEDKDISFAMPDTWEDRRIIAFSAPKPSIKAVVPNLVLSREKPNPGESLEEYANRQLVQHARTVTGFKLVKHQRTTLGGVPAVEISFTWEMEAIEATLRQRQLIVARGAQMLSLMLTAPNVDDPSTEQELDAILATVRLT